MPNNTQLDDQNDGNRMEGENRERGKPNGML